MKKHAFVWFVVALVCLSSIWLAGCTEEKFFDVVIGDEICPLEDFDQDSASKVFTDTVHVAAGAWIDSTLARNGYSRGDISTAVFNGATYVVTAYDGDTDWVIGGEVLIQRIDIPGPEVTFLDYDDASVPGSLDNPQTALVTAAGAEVVNQMLADFLEGANPSFRLVVLNGDCTPDPSGDNRIVFSWAACLEIQLIATTSADVFEPL